MMKLRHLARYQRARAFAQQVADSIDFHLPYGQCSEDAVAAHLGVKRWTVQRRLALADVSYSQLFHARRMALVLRLLADPDRPLRDCADIAGFSTQPGLVHWCRRVLGATPSELRVRLVDAKYGRTASRIRV